MTHPSTPDQRPSPDPAGDRERLTELVGRLLARRCLRDRRRSLATDGSAAVPRTADDPLRRAPEMQ